MRRSRFWASQTQFISFARLNIDRAYAALTYSDDEAKAIELDRLRKVGIYLLWLQRHYAALSKELD